MPPLWSCDWENCQFPAVQRAGDCLLCDRHLCRTHLQDQWHKCPKPETDWTAYSSQYAASESRRLDELSRRIDGEKLCARASKVRGGIVPCTIDLSPNRLSSMMGGQNCHADVVFGDGLVWLVRIRLSSPISPPCEVRDYVLASEAATMEFMERHTRIPSPRVFDWAAESDPSNEVGVGYILMEKMNGTPLDWQGATMAQRGRVIQQLADILLEVEKHPFDKLGSLVPTRKTSVGNTSPREPQIQVKGLAQHSTFRSSDGNPPGPFSSSREALREIVAAHLVMITTGEIGMSEKAMDVFLAHRFRLDILDSVWPGEGDERFYLKHADDKGDHILVNADFDIVAIIDWEWCSTASKEEAFSSPCMMWPVAAFYDGSNQLAEEELLLARAFSERGREDLARCVLNGRRIQRLLFALGPGGASHQDRRTLACLFMGLERAFAAEHHFKEEKLGREEEEWEAWKARELDTWKEDELMQTFLGRN